MCLWFSLQVVHKSGFEKKTNTKDPCAVRMWYRGIRQSGLKQDTEIQINGKWYPILTWANYRNTNTENLCAYGIHSRLGQNTEIQIRKIPLDMASNLDLSKIQKHKYKETLYMVCNFDLRKTQKSKYKKSLCIWYPIRTWAKYRNTNTNNLCVWYSILTWANYRNTNTKKQCENGIPSRLGQNTEIQIQRISVYGIQSWLEQIS